MKRTQAAQLAARHLNLPSDDPYLIAPGSTKTPDPDQPGPIFRMGSIRADRGGGWDVAVWLRVADFLAKTKPDHRVIIAADGRVRAPGRRGRPRELPEGVARRQQVTTVLHDEDLAEVRRLEAEYGLTESAVLRALVAKALRRKRLPWK